jgi:hypothetical protein
VEAKEDTRGGLALLERASELCEQIVGRCLLAGTAHPTPRQLADAALRLNQARWRNTGHVFEPMLLVTTMWYLCPPHDR